jgi:hypothetical protein
MIYDPDTPLFVRYALSLCEEIEAFLRSGSLAQDEISEYLQEVHHEIESLPTHEGYDPSNERVLGALARLNRVRQELLETTP